MVSECWVVSAQLYAWVEGWLAPYQTWVLSACAVLQVRVKPELLMPEMVGSARPLAGLTVTEAAAVWVLTPSLAETVTGLAPLLSALAAMLTAADWPGVSVAGLTVQPEAGAVQVSVSGLVSPLTALLLSVRVAAVLAATVLVAGASATVKSGAGAGVTVT